MTKPTGDEEDDVRHWHQFDYYGGNKVSSHYVTEHFVQELREHAEANQFDVVITKLPDYQQGKVFPVDKD